MVFINTVAAAFDRIGSDLGATPSKLVLAVGMILRAAILQIVIASIPFVFYLFSVKYPNNRRKIAICIIVGVSVLLAGAMIIVSCPILHPINFKTDGQNGPILVPRS